jgi:hypothetical protein
MSVVHSTLIRSINTITGRSHHFVHTAGVDGIIREYAVWLSQHGDYDSDDEQLPYIAMVNVEKNELEMSQVWIRMQVTTA